MIINNIRGFILFLLFIQAGFSFSQIKVLGGTSIFVSGGTIINISGVSPDIFEIDSGAFVTNNGIITLGDSTTIKEFPGFPVKGSGFEEATRNLTQSLSNENIAGLGAILTTSDSLGLTIIKRGHTSYIDNSGNESILRWFNIDPSNNTTDNSLTFKYDSTELNNLSASNLYLYQSSDSGITWNNLGGISDSTTYSVYKNSIDSLSLFTLFPVKLITGIVSSDTLCVGQTITVPYSINGQVNSGNYFSLELSDNSGSFANPLLLDSVQSVNSGSITALVPIGLPGGSGYRIRVVSTDPVIFSEDNGSPLVRDTLPEKANKPVGDTAICALSDSMSNYSVSSIANASNYHWQLTPSTAGVVTVNNDSATIVWDAAFTGSAELSIFGSNACGAGIAETLFISTGLVPETATKPIGDTLICAQTTSSSSYFVNTINSATSYNWALTPVNAGSITISDTNATITWNEPYGGEATLSVTGINSCGAGASETIIISTKTLPEATTPMGDTLICVMLTPANTYTVNQTDADSYSWSLSPSDAGSITASNTSAIVTWNDQYNGAATLSVNGNNFCGAGPESNISVSTELLHEAPTGLLGDTTIDLANESVSTYSVNNINFSTSYSWTLTPADAGTLTHSGNTATVTWNNEFTGTATLTVAGKNSCGEGPEARLLITESGNPSDDLQINLLPNPAQDFIKLEITNLSSSYIDIDFVTLLGQVILRENINMISRQYTNSYDISAFAKGIYFLRLKTDTKWEVRKFIIE